MGGEDQTAVSHPGRVLVTGANGQLGRRLVERLMQSDPAVSVRALVRSERAAKTLHNLPERMRPETVVVDYRDGGQLARAAHGCRDAVHLVGIIKQGARSRYVDAHEASAQAMADAADQAALRRVLYLSILGTDPASPNPCLASKGRAEQILLGAKTPALVLRVAMVLGPGDATARIVRREALSRVLPLVAGGTSHTQPIFSGDLIEAIVAGITRNDLDDVTLDLAGPESLPHREFIERAARLYGRRPRVVNFPRSLAMLAARLAERWIADPPFTPASLGVILGDDDIDPKPACQKLGITLTPIDEILRRCVGPGAPNA